MARRRLIWKVLPAYLFVIVFSTAAVAWYAGGAVRQFYDVQTDRQLESKAALIRSQIAPLILAENNEQIQQHCLTLGASASVRITVILPDGRVIGDSDDDPGVMDNHSRRPEIVEAYAGKVGRSRRFSPTLRSEMAYVALPVVRDNAVIGVVRTAVGMTEVAAALRDVYVRIAIGGGVMALVAGVLTLMVFTRQLSVPLKQLQAGAKRFESGDLDHALPVPDNAEIGALADALNSMAAQLDEKLRTITAQSNERHAVLSSMVEGVLAVDDSERLITLNAAAARFLNVDVTAVRGRSIYEVLRQAQLQDLVRRALEGHAPVEGEINLRVGDSERVLQVQGTLMQGARSAPAGAVFVLHDVTTLRQLETMRKDFVANVSHELKTPITAIKAAVETLIDDEEEDTPRRRFAGIIVRQADRLNAIIDDLLTLARVEREDEAGHIALETCPLGAVLRGAMETCQAKARDKRIEIDTTFEPINARINATLLEQAVVNLLDNAIKYSNAESPVSLQAQRVDGEVVIRVADSGPGIEARHLPRLFERFYRTDRARSREMGGTGLGLSIVKHVAHAHGGRVTVESTPAPAVGHGSVFCIHLPDSADDGVSAKAS